MYCEGIQKGCLWLTLITASKQRIFHFAKIKGHKPIFYFIFQVLLSNS